MSRAVTVERLVGPPALTHDKSNLAEPFWAGYAAGMNPSPASPRHKIRLAGLVCGIGLIWSAQTWSASFLGFRAIQLTPGPLELCNLGVLVWLWARWHLRRSTEKQTHSIVAEQTAW